MLDGALRVTHAIPGRIRVKLGAMRGDASRAERVEEALAALPGIERAEANPLTGSVLVHYDPDELDWTEAARVLAPLLELPDRNAAPAVASRLATAPEAAIGTTSTIDAGSVAGFFQDVNERIGSATGGTDLKLLVPLFLVLLGVRGFFVAENLPAPRWYDLLWFGFGTFMMLNVAGVPPARAAEEAAEVLAAV